MIGLNSDIWGSVGDTTGNENMASPFKRIEWNEQETALLIDTYLSIEKGGMPKAKAITMLSKRLRQPFINQGIGISEKYRNENGISLQMNYIEFLFTNKDKGFSAPPKLFSKVVDMYLYEKEVFSALLCDAILKYPKVELNEESIVKEQKPTNSTAEKRIIKILKDGFPKGFQSDIFGMKSFNRKYLEQFGNSYAAISQEEIENTLREECILIKNRYYLPEQLIDNKLKESIKAYIVQQFKTKKQYIFFNHLFNHFKDELIYSNISDKEMLRTSLRSAFENKWFFTANYIAKNSEVKVDINEEVIEYIREQGVIISEAQLLDGLNYLPEEQVKESFSANPDILIVAGHKQRFHIDMFVVTKDELSKVCKIIDAAIDKFEYETAEELFADIKSQIPSLIENNESLSTLAMRNALNKMLGGKYDFKSAIISKKGSAIQSSDIIIRYARSHETFSLEAIEEVATSLNTNIQGYLSDILKYCVRIDENKFVSMSKVHFDVKAIDEVLSHYCQHHEFPKWEGDYCSIQDISDFTLFPNCNYPWTPRLLESYLVSENRLLSKRSHQLIYNECLSKNSVCGFVYHPTKHSIVNLLDKLDLKFLMICTIEVLTSGIEQTKESVLEHLTVRGYISRRRLKKVNTIIGLAKQIIKDSTKQ